MSKTGGFASSPQRCAGCQPEPSSGLSDWKASSSTMKVYALANAGHDTRLIQDWLGHRAIQHTARYTELSPTRFKDVWR